MIKAIFVSAEKIKGIDKSGANYLMVAGNGITSENWKRLKNLGMTLTISVDVCQGCPADPKILDESIKSVKAILKYQPDGIWLDHLRFDGRWEIESQSIKSPHEPCEWCQGKSRQEVITNFARQIKENVEGVNLGYFALPFKEEERPDLVEILGQDHSRLASYFNFISPMLYHRMIGKPVSYISDFVRYLSQLTGKPILPIIQVNDMPDDLEDKMTEIDISKAFNRAIQAPSEGVAIFWWGNATEKGKTLIISKLLNSI